MNNRTLHETLRNFIHLVERRDEQIKRGEDDYYAWEFLKIRIESEDQRSLPEFSCSVGSRPENARKNRYRDILPFDSSRVKITPYADDIDSDYINASLINCANGKLVSIAAQGPMQETVGDFWQMVGEYDVKTILMLCDLFEGGKSKCHHYWPDVGTTVEYSHSTIANTYESQQYEHFTVRHLTLTCHGRIDSHIKQFHYHGWPDHGTPDDIEPLLDFIEAVRQWQPESDLQPIVVHCSAGCGRSGTFCALDMIRTQLKNKSIPADFSICQLVSDLRKQRIAMVQSKDQYVLLHRAVAQLFTSYLEIEGKLKNGSSDIEDNRSIVDICPSSSSTSVFLNCCDDSCTAPIRPPRTRKAMRNRIIHSDSCSSMLLSEDQISLTKIPSTSSVFTHNSTTSAKSSPERSPVLVNSDGANAAELSNGTMNDDGLINCIKVSFSGSPDRTLISSDNIKYQLIAAAQQQSPSTTIFPLSFSLPAILDFDTVRKISTKNGIKLLKKRTHSVEK